MGYKIYYKNNIKSGAQSTHGKFEQYDRKNYATETMAKKSLMQYKTRDKKYRSVFRGVTQKYEIRKITPARKEGFGIKW